MKRMLMGFTVILMALAVQAQMGGVEKAIAGMEQQWAAAGKMSNADAIAPLLADNFTNLNSDGTMMNKPRRWPWSREPSGTPTKSATLR